MQCLNIYMAYINWWSRFDRRCFVYFLYVIYLIIVFFRCCWFHFLRRCFSLFSLLLIPCCRRPAARWPSIDKHTRVRLRTKNIATTTATTTKLKQKSLVKRCRIEINQAYYIIPCVIRNETNVSSLFMWWWWCCFLHSSPENKWNTKKTHF